MPSSAAARPWVLALTLLGLGGCAEPLVMSDFHATLGVNWKVRPNRHRGVDFLAKKGTPVLAAARGRVITSYMKPRVGWVVVIHHQDFDRKTRYLHLEGSPLKVGDLVERGQQIGTVGLFEFSAGVEHVHIELYDLVRIEGGLEDPMDWSVGCFDADADYPMDRLVLTYPIPCEQRWSNEQRPVESALTFADLSLEASGGAVDSVALRSRGLLYSELGVGQFRHFIGWDGSLGLDAEGNERYEARALTGVGIGHPLFDLALVSGVGTSRWGQKLESAFEIPIELRLRIKQRILWGEAWARSSYLFDAPTRQGDSEMIPSSADEIALGMSLRLPPLTKLATIVSLEYRHLEAGDMLLMGIGASFDTLF